MHLEHFVSELGVSPTTGVRVVLPLLEGETLRPVRGQLLVRAQRVVLATAI